MKPNKLLISTIAGIAVLAAGCAPEKENGDNLPITTTSSPQRPDTPNTEKPNLDAENTRSATENRDITPPLPNVATTPTVPTAQAAPADLPKDIDFATAVRPTNDQGAPMSDLEFLNHLVQRVNETRAATAGPAQQTFSNEAERSAYDELQKKLKAPVKDLKELVTAGVLKSLPAAPAGQMYKIDAGSGKVVLSTMSDVPVIY